MTIYTYNPYIRKEQIFENIQKVKKTSNGFRICKDKDFYKDFPRLCIWWEIKETSNPKNPCEDCLFAFSNLSSCKHNKHNLRNGRVVCAFHEKI